jgi:hypothetical protein
MNLADLFASGNVEDRRPEYPRMPGDGRITLDQIQQFWAQPQTMVPGSWRLDRLNKGYNALQRMPYAGPETGDYGGLGGEDIDRAVLQANMQSYGAPKTILRQR